MSEYVCDRCSCQLDEEEDNINDGPLESEWEGCTLCDACLSNVEDEADNDDGSDDEDEDDEDDEE